MSSPHHHWPGQGPIATDARGRALLTNQYLNKSTAFTAEERRRLGLEGLLPYHVSTMDEQVQRAHEHICSKGEELERFIGLMALQDRNEHLYYRLLIDHIETYLPIVYTPTVGLACQRYSHIFRRARGVWITPAHRGRIAEVLGNAIIPNSSWGPVRLIVVTDNERILGLGDQGAGGMGIPIGKLALYTAVAGIHPARTLPISLDVGTDNPELLADPLYLGWSHRRLRGDEYHSLVEEFVSAVETVFPEALLQWEDFKKVNAMNLLATYRERLLSFNDDVQGTAAVGLAGVLAAVRATGRPITEHQVVILGAGAAGVGIAGQIGDAMARAGLSRSQVTEHIAVLDSRGLLVEGRRYREGEEYKQTLSWPAALASSHGLAAEEGVSLEQVVKAIHPTVLIGTSGQPGVFTESIVSEMAAHTARPAIFPFSNPTSKSEAVPAEILRWSEGRALVATGSPFDPVELGGTTHRISQGNNVYVFPGVGLGAIAVGATAVTDSMFTVAAEVIAAAVSDADLEEGALFPRLTELRDITALVAAAVAEEAVSLGLAEQPPESLEACIAAERWRPEYPELVAKD